MRQYTLLLSVLIVFAGCSAFPDVVHEPQYHNPFPQLSRVAVLPFYNQSADPTVDQQRVAIAYYNELQQIPGFEVMPVGVAVRMLEAHEFDSTKPDFQKIARLLGVDAVVVGSITEYSPYYPPKMGISVDWYAANPGFHPIPPGYGLPWGTPEEEYIPDSLVFESEFALAKAQLETQTPEYEVDENGDVIGADSAEALAASVFDADAGLPADWPNPAGFVPPPPSPSKPALLSQTRPVMSLTRMYNGHDEWFTARLANYFYFRDDARFGGWQAYLQRSDDFIRFCCHLHVTELLAARGGAGKSRVVWRWPIGRYER